ncbi:XRE family transcriptional regulator [Enterococcus faecalis]|uniref:XRE family transcriptional regulator n=1 Tax=Enterococcus TaxID=1350 RepID=UPI0015A48267|nr:XRE family transcriptional regulator [Enterococcus faecalis]EGO5243168.1 XRE family transcriptional regulator [Enterococcus faecalis]EGO6530491.1 XRE family transcriptional regulator [Enterococcus faecalis]EGO7887689.1 XRE family transcriptional regulator [Enterococcus faecalis]EGO7907482.1 XRE family transcriptional regulator [Enterococcus faecalis]EGO8634592.1 XRE family transcriptional regulator [Enterococcus faecalis]
MTYTEKIEKLIHLDLTSYRIAKETGISTQYIDKIRSGKTAIENIGLGKAEALMKYFDELNNDSSKYITFDTSNLTELKRFNELPELEAVSRVKNML